MAQVGSDVGTNETIEGIHANIGDYTQYISVSGCSIALAFTCKNDEINHFGAVHVEGGSTHKVIPEIQNWVNNWRGDFDTLYVRYLYLQNSTTILKALQPLKTAFGQDDNWLDRSYIDVDPDYDTATPHRIRIYFNLNALDCTIDEM